MAEREEANQEKRVARIELGGSVPTAAGRLFTITIATLTRAIVVGVEGPESDCRHLRKT